MDRILNDDALLDAYNQVVDVSYEGGHPTVLEGIDMSLPYRPMDMDGGNNLHIGQRKLFMNELQFLVDHIDTANGRGTVVYAGSAPSMHLPYLAGLYPRLKFVLVDPNEHCLIMRDAPHDRYGDTRVTHYTHGKDVAYVSSRPDDRSRFRMADGSSPQRMIQVWDGKKMQTLNRPSQGRYPKSQTEIGNRIVSCLKRNKNIRYVISEAYFTDELCRSLTGISGPIFFWSDIRTSVSEHPTEADITINNLQQMRWVSILKPEASMLKFRPPYYPTDTDDPLQMERYRVLLNQLEAALTGSQASLFRWAQEELRIDALLQAQEQKFTIPVGELYIQPWAGIASGEMRLRLSRWNGQVREIDVSDYEDKMFAYNRILRPYRFYASHPRDQSIGIDACGDCALEMKIWQSYIDKYDVDADPLIMAGTLSSRTGPVHRSLLDENHGKFQSPYSHISEEEALAILNSDPPYASDVTYDQGIVDLIMTTDNDADVVHAGLHAIGLAIVSSPIKLIVVTDKVTEVASALSSYDGFNLFTNGNTVVRFKHQGHTYIVTLTDEEGMEREYGIVLDLGQEVEASNPLRLGIMNLLYWTNRNKILNDNLVVEMAIRSSKDEDTRDGVVYQFFDMHKNTNPMSYDWMSRHNRSMWGIASRYIRKGINYFEDLNDVMSSYDVVYITDAMNDSFLRQAFRGITINKMRSYPRGERLYIMMTGESPVVMDMGMKRWIDLMKKKGNDIRVRRIKPV